MIKSHMGNINVEGSRAEVMADLAVAVQTIMEALVKNGSEEEAAKGQIMNAVNVGIRRASSDYEESPVEKKIRELVTEIVKSMGAENVDRKRS